MARVSVSMRRQPEFYTRMTITSHSVPWRGVAFFYAFALLLALPFNLNWYAPWFAANLPSTPFAVWPFLPAALGPALGAALARRIGPQPATRTSLLGASASRSLITAVTVVVVFGFLGLRSALFALVAVLYATGEEFGWRGFLADSLSPLPPHRRLLLTAALWWFWHLRFDSVFDLLYFPVIIVLSSILLGHAARGTGSFIVPGAMHALVILLSSSGTPSRPMLIAAAVTVGFWVLLGAVWPHPRPDSPSAHEAA